MAIDSQNTEFLRSALAEVRRSHREAESEFEAAEREIDRINSTTINIFYDNPYAKIVEAVHISMEAGKELNFTCQALVISLDELCRPRLTGGVSADVVSAIAREIESLNEDSKINLDYTGSLDGASFGDVAKVSLEPTIQARAIETFWRTKANEYEKIQADIRKKQEDAAYIKKHNIAAKDIGKHRKYEAAISSYENATTSKAATEAVAQFELINGYLDSAEYIENCQKKAAVFKEKEEAAEQKRKQAAEEKKKKEKAAKEHMDNTISECNAKVDEFKKKLNSALRNHMRDFESQINAEIDSLNKQKADSEAFLSTLGIFKFSAKKETKNKILRLSAKIEKLKTPSIIENEKAAVKKIYDKEAKDYSKKVKEYLEARFPGLVPKPVEYDFSGRTENESIKLRILYALTKSSKLTIEQIQNKVKLESQQKTSALVRQLKEEGEVIRGEEKGKAVFSLAGSAKSVLNRLPVKPAIPSYKEVEKYAKLGCPEAPQIKDIELNS